MDHPLYHIQGVTHGYGDATILSIDELKIRKGSITGLSGRNGSGKSTLLKLMAFVDKPKAGLILFNGLPASPFSPAIRFRVALLAQTPYLMKRSVYNNIAYGLTLRKTTENMDEKIHAALGWVGLPHDRFLSRKWDALSGGEAKRVALAARLVLKPEVLLMDEPTANVDLESSELISRAALMARVEWGTTLVIASHDREWLSKIAETHIHLHEGKMIQPGYQ
jgi:tungstate transport system ATP-binding protein